MMFWTASSCGLVLVLSLAQILRVRRRLAYAVAGQAHLDQHRRFLIHEHGRCVRLCHVEIVIRLLLMVNFLH
ncbi:hypothetical protein AtNW77_Chr4g0273661 [Arabidopsis thaliana]